MVSNRGGSVIPAPTRIAIPVSVMMIHGAKASFAAMTPESATRDWRFCILGIFPVRGNPAIIGTLPEDACPANSNMGGGLGRCCS